jgi:DNA-binding beta-propeller fold protein YncE
MKTINSPVLFLTFTPVLRVFALFLTMLYATLTLSETLPTLPNGTLWVVNKNADTVSIIDIRASRIVNTLATGKGPHELAMNLEKTRAVVTNYVGGNSLSVYDIANQKLLRTIDLSHYSMPHGIVFLPDGNHVAVSSEGSNTAIIANIETGEITRAIDTEAKGSHMVALPQDGNTIYTPNMKDHTVSVLDAIKGSLIEKIDTPQTPEAIGVNRDNTMLWVGSNKDGWLTVYDRTTGKLAAQWKDYTWPYRVIFSPDESMTVVPDLRRNTIDFFDTNTLSRTKRIHLNDNAGPKGLTFHPDGKVLFLSLYNQDKIAIIDTTSGETLALLPTGDGPDGIGFVVRK